MRYGPGNGGRRAVESSRGRRLIRGKLPDQFKLSHGLWTRKAVQQLIERRYGVELACWQVGHYHKAWGYTPQKPIAKVFEQKPKRVKKWLEEEYPVIRERAGKVNGTIYFSDETGMLSDHPAR